VTLFPVGDGKLRRLMRSNRLTKEETKELWENLFPLLTHTRVKFLSGSWKGRKGWILSQRWDYTLKTNFYMVRFEDGIEVGYYTRKEIEPTK